MCIVQAPLHHVLEAQWVNALYVVQAQLHHVLKAQWVECIVRRVGNSCYVACYFFFTAAGAPMANCAGCAQCIYANWKAEPCRSHQLTSGFRHRYAHAPYTS